MTRFAGPHAVVAVGLAAALLLAGCAEPRPLPTPTPTPSETLGPLGDGVLRVGAILPLGGDTSGVGPGMVAAIEIAVRDLNMAGGVLGAPVEAFYRDAGAADSQRLEASFAELVARDIDVVIGPSSPALLDRLLPLAAGAGVAVIASSAPSPTARAAEPAGSLLRTIPAVDREAVAIAQSIAANGLKSIAIITATDARGQSVVDAVRAALDGTATEIGASERIDTNSNSQRLSFSIAASDPEAVIIASDGVPAAQTAAVIAALLARGVTAEQLWLTSSGAIDFSSIDAVNTLPAGSIEGMSAVRAGAAVADDLRAALLQSDPRVGAVRFAPETYDAVVVAALAAVIAGDDSGSSIVRSFAMALGGQVPCTSAGQCLDVLANGQTIDYEGRSGKLAVDSAGDIVAAELEVFRYDAENRLQPSGTVSLTRG